jgi:molybdopterin/thiamine biosynthesis adenylyltransferase/rhodanese-related sulfurtransferase
MDDFRRLLLAARARIKEIPPQEVAASDALLVDIREADELALGLLPDAVAIPMRDLPAKIREVAASTDTPIVLYCAVGERSAIAAAQLADHGYSNVFSLAGGIKHWMALGYPTIASSKLTAAQRHRYARHLVLPGVGSVGQQRLLEAAVVIVGAGGLGSPAALYLAAAGVGRIGIIDDDAVDLSNLQRQILHSTPDAGQAKTVSAAARLAALNPGVEVIPVAERLGAGNALETLDGYDVIIDGTDNFATRYLINDASLHLRIPVVHGSVFRFEGQISVFAPYEGPCYRCLFPEPPPADLSPNCTQAGVFGVLPGVIGTMQATEALKLLLGIGIPLVGKLLTYDGLDQSTHIVNFGRNPECAACGDERRPPVLREEADYC